ncbi:unnamed protein product [Rotaria sp. Silwood2]|nr:unnamed protein product [Rotaria sp. Silwood2]CAF2759577.1 unnamed protein product [Rotaria sp. Silwood2]CAF3193447.1 unnamed protein product [Rotaria sp. Silwood2]CAF3945099.1 unnamed protein product [Rotaria sp. Silwood2]CAF4408262.1 unnamed protein product [Rotaria sp. Silwood2]
MHYGSTTFSKNGLNTIEPLQPGAVIGQRKTLSAIDIQEVRLFYGCDATGATLPSTSNLPLAPSTINRRLAPSTSNLPVAPSTSNLPLAPSTSPAAVSHKQKMA